MKIFYSMARKGFFPADIYDAESLPQDALEIAEQEYKDLLEGQTTGKQITWDGEAPYLADPFFSSEQLAKIARDRRDMELGKTDWTQLSDVPQAVKEVWSVYRQALRDVPQQAGFPHNITWPDKP